MEAACALALKVSVCGIMMQCDGNKMNKEQQERVMKLVRWAIEHLETGRAHEALEFMRLAEKASGMCEKFQREQEKGK